MPLLSYLLLTDTNDQKPDYTDYTKLTLKELRNKCLEFLVNFEEQKGETVEQNQQRYLAVFALLCSDWVTQSDAMAPEIGAINNSWSSDARETITKLKVDKQSQATILRLAGLDNRPYEELVGAEYSIDFTNHTSDEAYGDIFIICTFDEELKLYVPFLMGNTGATVGANLPTDEEGYTWLSKYNFRTPSTEYYASADELVPSVFFPIIARGIIDEEGNPTAIREVEGNIEYYRDEIIIHNTSTGGLSTYFATVEQIPVHHTGLSYMVNTFSKMFTGKTLIEHLVATVPRLAVDADLNLCYGTESNLVAYSIDGKVLMNYNFVSGANPGMKYFYSIMDMNILVILIGVFTLTIALWKAVWGAIGRLFSITLYALVGPAVISTINLSTDTRDEKKKESINEKGSEIYGRWKSSLINDILLGLSMVVGLNMFFIVVPIIEELVLFESNAMYAHLPLFRNISVGFLNELARLIFLIAAARLSVTAPKLFESIVGTKSIFDKGQETMDSVEHSLNNVGQFVSGAALATEMKNAKVLAEGMIPGVAIVKEVGGQVVKECKKFVKKAVARTVEVAAIAASSGAAAPAGELINDSVYGALDDLDEDVTGMITE